MAQLSNDCFAFGGTLLSVEAALARITDQVGIAAGTEETAVRDADGRVLAEDLLAPLALPPYDNSAVDGYAVRFADLSPCAPSVLPVAGRLAAGAERIEKLLPGSACRIFTGAPLPAGADTVFMQEDVKVDVNGRVVLPPGLARGANARARGEDIAQHSRALAAGHRLRPQDLALAAALGLTRLTVHAPVRVGVFSTGNEVAEPGAPLPPSRVYDSNRVLIAALVRRAGGKIDDLGILQDNLDATAKAIDAASSVYDLIVTSGGVSTGEEDHVKAAVEAVGRMVTWRLALKPGRPVAMGVVRGTPLVGLPGNPVAVFVTFAVVVRPLLMRLGGETFTRPTPLPVRADFAYRKKSGRREYVRVRLRSGPDGVSAVKHPQDGAGILTSLTETDGLVELPEPVTRIQPGDQVGFLPYSALL